MPRPVTVTLVFVCAILAFQMFQSSGSLNYDSGRNYLSRSKENEIASARDLPEKRSSSIFAHRIGCIPRGGICDYNKSACCNNTACRCNLWGTNCRCQRIGLFQKWG